MAIKSRNRRPAARRRALPRLSTDEAFIALLIGAMHANAHMAPDEAARADQIIWSMNRFRRRSGDAVTRLIDRMRSYAETHGPLATMTAAVNAIPARLRPSAFALSSDVVLADGRMSRAERQFLRELASRLGLEQMMRDGILDAMLIKNRA
jgi:tellurite resistance protein